MTRYFDGDVRARNLTCLPSFKFDYQNKISILSLGCQIIYQKSAYLGFFHQSSGGINAFNTNAFCFVAGWKFQTSQRQNFDLGINYDVNGTGISMQSGGTIEVTLNMNFPSLLRFSDRLGSSAQGKRILKCHTFF
jgi:hypothetical protein